MKLYKVLVESLQRTGGPDFTFKDINEAKKFACNNLKETINSVSAMSIKSKEIEGKEYIFKPYSDKDIEKISLDFKQYSKAVKRIDDYIIEIAENCSGKTHYTYQIKNDIIKRNGVTTDSTEYIYSVEIRELELIE